MWNNKSWRTNGASLRRCSARLKAPPTKPRENRAKRGVTRGISGWVLEPLVRHPACPGVVRPQAPVHLETDVPLLFLARDELLNDKPYYIFCGELEKVCILRPFCVPAFYSGCCSGPAADGTRIVPLSLVPIRKTALIWNPDWNTFR